MNQTPTEHLHLALRQQRAAFEREPMPTLAVRRDRLRRVHAMTLRHADALADAIAADFGHRARQETLLAEVFTVRAGARHAIAHVGRWMKARRVATQLHFLPGRNRLLPQPLGVAGIVAPWNYPYYLSMAPAIAALAAGNRVMIKPSELTPATSQLLATMVAADFAADEMQVVTGDAEVGRAFVELPFDHLFFTGSTAVGRLVAQAAARNLTPVTLELGGKSPAIVDTSCDLPRTAERLAFGKLLNAGQTCVAPDYILAPKPLVEPLVEQLVAAMRRLYPRLTGNPDYTAIVSARHHARLQALLDDARAKGARLIATHDETPADRRFVPHLLTGVDDTMAVMRDEIFGPILPIVGCNGVDDALARVRSRERPLALYWFGRDARTQQRVLEQTYAGGVTVNDCIWHLGQENQPFGGIGASGHGAYHGVWGFNTFSKHKPVFVQSALAGTALLRPPYGRVFDRLLNVLGRMSG
ncbi:MAG: coniferyl aldehyde dehydrogenase [Ideonella sp.]|nr:coniferyl aldehyde dehydrogenase [Ideonella sp.]MCC7457137.1 coniferyl aldehyde dehydrogenase [Nitrospira sp.]